MRNPLLFDVSDDGTRCFRRIVSFIRIFAISVMHQSARFEENVQSHLVQNSSGLTSRKDVLAAYTPVKQRGIPANCRIPDFPPRLFPAAADEGFCATDQVVIIPADRTPRRIFF